MNNALLISQGDEQAFNEVYFALLPKLKPFVYKLTRSMPDTQEIIQETFTDVWANRSKLATVENVDAWVFKMASCLCYNFLRRKTIARRVTNDLWVQANQQCNNTQEKVALDELTHVVDQLIEKLPERRKKVYLMSRVGHLKIPEIADLLGISPNTVKNTLVSSLKQLRENLKVHDLYSIIPPLLMILTSESG